MREILFRGKRVDNGEWVEGYYACESNHACFAYELKYHHYIFKDVFLDWNLGGLEKYEVIPETIGQYTGLRDNTRTEEYPNGKKIFEGDIVRKNANGKELIGKIEYAGGAFGVRFADGSGQFLCFFVGGCEVIGNIHDNPELLRKEDEEK